MKNNLSCAIVRDLLPSYIDGLTSQETNESVKAHLNECTSCRAAYREMTGIEPPKAEQPEIVAAYMIEAQEMRLTMRH